MKISITFIFFMFTINSLLHANWTNMNTGINDDLSGVVFASNNGLMSGKKGLYITTTGGNGPSSWKRFTISNNSNDAIIYNQTKFNHCFAYNSNLTNVFACGQDTVNQNAIIIKISFPTLSYSIIYKGKAKSSLNKIGYCSDNISYYAVGDSGLIVSFNTTTVTSAAQPLKKNLKSISFNNSNFCIGAGSNLIFGSLLSQTSYSFTVNSTNSYNFKDVIMLGFNNAYGVGDSYYYAYSLNYTTQQNIDSYQNYDFGPLTGNCIYRIGTRNFVGTDHGIFKSSPSQFILEWQPSSEKFAINAFCGSNNNLIYACGKNGVLLSTLNDGSSIVGGLTKPYAKLDAIGNCIGDYVYFSGGSNTTSSCTWYSNDVLIQNGSCSFSLQYNSKGVYRIKLITSNGTYRDTNTKDINIVSKPYINNRISTNKNLLCKKEPLIITIDSSEQNVYYSIYKSTGSNFGNSGIGNGNAINFSTLPLIDGKYILKASSTLANCVSQYRDSIIIDVEQTKATFHNGTINAEIGESVRFTQNCVDAQNYKWTFSPNADIVQSFDSIPIVKFSTTDSTKVKLICWSNNGCYDTTMSSGPTIFQKINPLNNCWNNVNDYTNASDPNPHFSTYSNVIKSKSGILGCGSLNNSVFNSQFGSPFKISTASGGYLAKYDFDGTLKWMVYTKGNKSYQEEIFSAVEDEFGNIYLSSNLQNTFVDNAGRSINTLLNLQGFGISNNYCLIKLDPNGKLIWFMRSNFSSPEKLLIDKSNHLIAQFKYQFPSYSKVINRFKIALNGVVTDSITVRDFPRGDSYFIARISPTGEIKWNIDVIHRNTNLILLTKINTDKDRNIYLAGTYEHSATFYSADSLTGHQISLPGTYGPKMYVVKFDSNGIFKWKLKSYTSPANTISGLSEVWCSDAITDTDGNLYITGTNYCQYDLDSQVVENADNSIIKSNIGRYFITKINSRGKFQWVQGCNRSGQGLKVLLDQNKICVIGNLVSINNYNAPNNYFTSKNNVKILVTSSIGGWDYFIASYDTSGNLIEIFKNGNNKQVLRNNHIGFFKGSNDSYYMASNFWYYLGIGQNFYNNFGSAIEERNPSNNQGVGFISRFTPACGINVYNSIVTATSKSQIPENSGIFPNPTTGRLELFGFDNLDNVTFEIFNLQSRTLLRTSDYHELDISRFEDGVYFVLVSRNGEIISRMKVVKVQ